MGGMAGVAAECGRALQGTFSGSRQLKKQGRKPCHASGRPGCEVSAAANRFKCARVTICSIAEDIGHRRSRGYQRPFRLSQVQEAQCYQPAHAARMVCLHIRPYDNHGHRYGAQCGASRPGSFLEFYKIVEIFGDDYNIVIPFIALPVCICTKRI